MTNVKPEILERLITILTLKTQLDSDLFVTTVGHAVQTALEERGVPHEAALDVSKMLTPTIIVSIMTDREIVRRRTVDHVLEEKVMGRKPCERPGCGFCRVVAWAMGAPPADHPNTSPEDEAKIANALQHVDKDAKPN